MRCDLHVHSWYSGRAELPVLEHVGRECYSDPLDVEEFLAGLRTGLTVPSGRSGSYARLTSEVVRVFAAGYAETLRELLIGAPSALRVAASLAMAPFLPAIPLFTLGVYLHERRFGARQFRLFQQAFGWPTLLSEQPGLIDTTSLEEAA